MKPTVQYTGISGSHYEFEVFSAAETLPNVSGVYVFASQGTLLTESHAPLYVGESEHVAERLEHHEKWDCVRRYDCRFLCLHRADYLSRMAIEKDIMERYKPPCNLEV